MKSKAAHLPPVSKTPGRADGVTYETIPGAPGEFFRYSPYRAKLSTVACAKRWRAAQSATGYAADQIEKCRSCELGALHSGAKIVRYSTLYGSLVCPRWVSEIPGSSGERGAFLAPIASMSSLRGETRRVLAQEWRRSSAGA
jgi:hypothetical protein